MEIHQTCKKVLEMTKLGDVIVSVDLADGKPHVVTIDPRNDVEERDGRNGKYNVLLVGEEGTVRELNMGKTLTRALQGLRLAKLAKVEITRLGEGFNVSYTVKVVG